MPNRSHNNVGRKVALGGFITALAVISLYLSSVFPTNRLFFYAFSTIFLLAMVVEYGPASAFIVYAATTFLAAIIVPNKIMLIPYGLFFGYYGILKYFIEKICNFILEWVLKLLTFNIAMGVTYWIVFRVLFQTLEMRFSLWIMVLLIEAIFIIYDIAYSLSIKYYKEKIGKLFR